MLKYGLINLSGNEVLPCEYSCLWEPYCGLLVCSRGPGDKFGYIDPTGKWVIPPTFDMAFSFDVADGLASVVVRRDGVESYGLIDPTGRVVVKPVYHTLEHPAEGLCRFRTHDSELYGFLDRAGAVAIPPRFREASDFRFGLSAVADQENYDESYFIDHAGRRVLGPYPAGPGGLVFFEPSGIAALEIPNTHQWHLIDRTERVLFVRPPGINSWPPPFGAYMDEGEKAGKLGLRQAETGRWLSEAKYDRITRSAFGPFYRVQAGEAEGLLDLSGREISPLGARNFGYGGYGCDRIAFYEGLERDHGKAGYLAIPTGEVLIPAKYRFAGRYSEGFAIYIK